MVVIFIGDSFANDARAQPVAAVLVQDILNGFKRLFGYHSIRRPEIVSPGACGEVGFLRGFRKCLMPAHFKFHFRFI